MRKLGWWLSACLFVACIGDELPHLGPYDSHAPTERQAKATLRGVVTLQGETDHSQISIQLQDKRRTYVVETDQNGSFKLTGIVPGMYAVRINSRSYQQVNTEVTLQLAEDHQLPALTLVPKTSAVFGQALLERLVNGSLVTDGGVMVVLKKIATPRGRQIATAPHLGALAILAEAGLKNVYSGISGPDGAFRIEGVEAGEYEIVAAHSMENATSNLGRVKVTGEDGDVRVSDVILQPMYGRVEILGKSSAGAVSTTTVQVRLDATGNPTQVELAYDPMFLTALPRFAFVNVTTVTLSAGDGLKTLYARYFDSKGNQSSLASDSVQLDQTPPLSPSLAIGNSVMTNSLNLDVRYSAVGAVSYRLGTDLACTNGGRFDYGSGSYTLPVTSDGVYTVCIVFFDEVGNATSPLSRTIQVDATPPTAGILLINYGQSATNSNVVTLTFPGTTGATLVKLSESADFADAFWLPLGNPPVGKTFLLSPGNGLKTVYAKFADEAGNESAVVVSDSIVVDTVAPAFNGLSGPAASNVTGITLSLVASGADQMRLSESADFTGASWQVFTTNPGFTLSAGEGTKTVYVQLRDAAGNESLVRSVAITYDTTAPMINAVSLVEGALTNGFTVTLQSDVTDAVQMMVSESAGFVGATWLSYQDERAFTLTSDADGVRNVYVKYRDAAGNETAVVALSIEVDRTVPVLSSFQINAGASYTRLSVVNLTLAASDAHAITEMMVANNSGFVGGRWEPFTTATSWLLSNDSGLKMLYAKVRDAAGNESVPMAASITLDAQAPYNATLQINGGAAATNNRVVNLTLSAVGADEMIVGFSSDFAGSSWVAYANSATVNTLADGVRTVYARFRDWAGNQSDIVLATIVVDTVAPVVSRVEIDGPSITGSLLLRMALAVTGADEMQLSESPSFSGAAWVAYSVNPSFTLAAGSDGTRTVYARFRDVAGNLTSSYSDSVILDTLAPTGATIAVNEGATYATHSLVTLSLAATGADEMMVSEDPLFVGASWEPYAQQRPFVLSAGEGLKRIYAKFRDGVGNETAMVEASIILDASAPQVPSITIATPIDGYANQVTVPLVLAATNADFMLVSESSAFTDTTWQPYAPSLNFVLRNTQGAHTVYAKFKDDAGNETAVVSDTVVLDTVKPAISRVQIDEGAYTKTRTVNLTLFATGADTMKIAETSDLSLISAQPYASVSSFELSAAEGMKTLYVEFQDAAGNKSAVYPVYVTLDTVAPALPTIVLNAGAMYATNRFAQLTIITDGSASEVQISEDPLFGNSAWQWLATAVTTITYTLQSVDDGNKTVYVRVRDHAGNISARASDSIILDTLAPTDVFVGKATSPQDYANNSVVALTIAATSADYMRLSTDGTFDVEPWVAYSASTNVNVGTINELKTVYVQFKDLAGNLSQVAQTSFYLDTQAPVAGTLEFFEGAYAASTSVGLKLTASGADYYETSWDGVFDTEPRLFMAPGSMVTLPPVDGLHTIWVRYLDRAENYSATVSASITLDRQPPVPGVPPVQINNGALNTNSQLVQLTLNVTGATEMWLWNGPGGGFGMWEPFTVSTTWFLPPTMLPEEPKDVFAMFRDAAGNTIGPFRASITLDTTPPQDVGLAVAGGAYSNDALVQLNWQPSREENVVSYGLYADEGFGYGSAISTVAAVERTVLLTGRRFSDRYALRSVYGDGRVSALSRAAEPNLGLVQSHAQFLLVVDQDNSTADTQTVLLPYLDALGYSGDYTVYNYTTTGPSLADLQNYQIVVWNAPYQPPSFSDLQILEQYAQRGGNVFLIAPALPTWYGGSNLSFVRNGLGVLGYGTWSAARELYGRVNDPIGHNLVFRPQQLTYAYGPQPILVAPNVAVGILEDAGSVYATRSPVGRDATSRLVFQSVPLEWMKYDNAVSTFNEVPFIWRPTPITIPTISWDPERSEYQSLQFLFPYLGEVFTYTYYNLNGSLTFDYEGYIDPYNAYTTPIPSSVYPNRIIAPLRRDLNVAQGGSLSYNSTTTVYTLAYNYVRDFATPATQSFQVSLFPDGTIEFSYRDVRVAGQPTVIGIEDATGQRGVSLPVTDRVQKTYRYAMPVNSGLGEYLKRAIRWMAAPEAVTKVPIPYVTLSPSARGATQMQISVDGTFDTEPWIAYAGAISNVVLPAGDGTKVIYIRYRDAAGNESPIVSATSTLDLVAPILPSIVINAGAAYTNSLEGKVDLTLSAVDSGSGVDQMILSATGSFLETPIDYATTYSGFPLASTNEGRHYVWARFIDKAGNYSVPVSSSIILDKTPPVPLAITLASGVAQTRSQVVQVTLAASDNYVVAEMQLSESANFSDAAWEPFTTSTTWLLSPGDGFKRLYARFRDAAGNVASIAISDTITLDTRPPETPQVTIVEGHLTNRTVGVVAWDRVHQPDVIGYRVYECDNWCGGPNLVTATRVDLPSSAYYYQPTRSIDDFSKQYLVITRFADGTTSAFSPTAYFTYGQDLTPKQSILVVDDDDETSGTDLLKADLQAIGYAFDTVTVPAGLDGPSVEILRRYATIIWSSHTAPNPLTPNDEYNLSGAWDDRTIILLAPGYLSQSSWHWFRSYLLLGVPSAATTPTLAERIVGIPGNTISNGMTFRPVYPSGFTRDAWIASPNWNAIPFLRRSITDSTSVGLHTAWDPNAWRHAVLTFPYAALATRAAGAEPKPYFWATGLSDTGIYGDDTGRTFQLPFNFPFDGTTYNFVNISTNGFVSFQFDGLGRIWSAIPDPTPPNAVIAPFWRDLINTTVGRIEYGSYADAFTISWDSVRNYANPNTQSFQLTLYPNGEFLATWRQTDWDGTIPTTTGLENRTGTSGGTHDYTTEGKIPDYTTILYSSEVPDPYRRTLLRNLLHWSLPPNHVRRTSLPNLGLTLSAVGAVQMQISTDGVFDTESWVAYSDSAQVTLPDGQGLKRVYVRYRDEAGNETVAVSDYTVIDTIPPYASAITIVAENGEYTNSQFVTIQLPATEATYVMLSEDPTFANAVSQTWAPSANFILSSSDGVKYVYARFLDAAGNQRETSWNNPWMRLYDGITLDRTPPEAPVIANASQVVSSPTVVISLVDDRPRWNEVNFDDYEIKGGPLYTWTRASSISGCVLPSGCTLTLPNDGEHRISVRARDRAGNVSGEDSVTLTLDTQPPPAPLGLRIDNGNGFVNLSWTSPAADVVGYRIYYGPASGVWTGSFAAEGPSPIAVGNRTSFRLSGLPNGSAFIIGVSAIDRAGWESPLAEGTALPNKVTPTLLADIPIGVVRDLSWGNGLLTAVQAGGIKVYDVSNPTMPALVSTINGSNFYRAALDFPHLYALDQSAKTLTAWNVGNPASPTLLGTHGFTTAPYGLSVTVGAVVVVEDSRMTYFKRSADGTLSNITNASIYSPTRSVYCVPGKCFVGDGAYIDVYDTSTSPPSLNNLGYVYLGSGVFASDLQVHGNLVYMAVGSGGLRIIDVSVISGPNSLKIIGSLNSQNARSVFVEGNYAYLGDGSAKQGVIIDIADPFQPTVGGVVATGSDEVNDFDLEGNLAAVATSRGLQILAIGTPSLFVPLATYVPTSSIYNFGRLSLDGTRLVGGWYNDSFALTVSDAAQPKFVSKGLEARGVAQHDDYVLSVQDDTFRVLDAQNLVVRGTLSIASASLLDVKPFGTLALLADKVMGVHVVRLSSPASLTAPAYVATCRPTALGAGGCSATPGAAAYGERVAHIEQYALVADADQGYLWGIALSNPSAPIPSVRVATSMPSTVCSWGRRAVVAQQGTGDVRVYDLEMTPLNFVYRGQVSSGGNVLGCALSGHYLYLAKGAEGLKVYNLENVGSPVLVVYDTWGELRDVVPSGVNLFLGDYLNGMIAGRIEP